MKKDNMTYCWDGLDEKSTEQLDVLLQDELQQTQPDGENVRLILKVLEKRDKVEEVACGSEIERAWEKYQKRTGKAAVAPARRYGWLLRVASIILIIGIIAMAMPQQAQAEGLFDRVAHWTDSFFQLLGFGDTAENVDEYVFQTDNPGLQQVYDAVVELGVTEPVVPMWLPEGFALSSLDVDYGFEKTILSAVFMSDEQWVVVSINVYADKTPSKYYKDESSYSTYEINGTVHNVMQDDDIWVAVWMKDNIECCVSLECQENVLQAILKSIYSLEVE